MNRTQGMVLQKEARRKEVIRIFRENAHIRAVDVAKTLNVSANIISQDIREITAELKREKIRRAQVQGN
mgnify:CR=1 FL=1